MITFDLLIQNNGSKQEWAFKGLVDSGTSKNFYIFPNLDLTELPTGEYTYALVLDLRNDVEYELSNVLLNTVAKTSEGNVLLKDLNPELGLLKLGDKKTEIAFNKNNTDFIYYKK